MLKFQSTEPQNETLFRREVITDVISEDVLILE